MTSRIQIKIIGKNPDYFLKELIKKKINIYQIDKDNKTIKIWIDYKDYEIIKKIKTTYKITIINSCGLIRIKYLLKKYGYLFLFFIIGILTNIILSNMIFKVEVNHPNKELRKIVKKDLKELGLSPYKWKINYSKKEKIKQLLLRKEKDRLEWVEIEEKGTTYQVQIEEKKLNKVKEECLPRNIISTKKALILEIQSSTGEISKKKGDYVEKGEIIISGFIHNKDKIVSKTCATGVVYGETWYLMKILIPKYNSITKLDNHKSFGISYKIGKKENNIGNSYSIYEKTEYNIIKSNIIPLNISVAKYQKKIIKEKIRSLKEIDKLALKLAEDKMKEQLTDGEEVLMKKVLKKQEKNSKIEVEVFIEKKENITDYVDISNIDINTLNKEEG